MRSLLASCVLFVASMLVPGPAEACDCGVPLRILLPADASSGIPLNTRIWSTEPLELVAAGASVPVRRTSLWTFRGERIDVLTPEDPLAPNTSYQLIAPGGWVRSTFETGEEADTDRPAPPRAPEPRIEVEPVCDSHEYTATWQVESEGLLLAVHGEEPVFYGGTWGIDETGPSGVFTSASDGPTLRLGSGPCIWNWREAGPGVTEHFRLGLFDLAGNFSGWSEPSRVSFPEARQEETPREPPAAAPEAVAPGVDGAGGCAAATGAATPAALLASLLVAMRAGRARSSRAAAARNPRG